MPLDLLIFSPKVQEASLMSSLLHMLPLGAAWVDWTSTDWTQQPAADVKVKGQVRSSTGVSEVKCHQNSAGVGEAKGQENLDPAGVKGQGDAKQGLSVDLLSRDERVILLCGPSSW